MLQNALILLVLETNLSISLPFLKKIQKLMVSVGYSGPSFALTSPYFCHDTSIAGPTSLNDPLTISSADLIAFRPSFPTQRNIEVTTR